LPFPCHCPKQGENAIRGPVQACYVPGQGNCVPTPRRRIIGEANFLNGSECSSRQELVTRLDFRVRHETDADIPAIHALTQAAFLEAPHTAHTEHLIVDALRDAGALFLSLVAEDEGVVVGHVAISPIRVSDGAAGWYGLGPISVQPGRQRRGIGSGLMREVLWRLEESGASGCVLVGDPAFYGRFGFEPDRGLAYPGVPSEYVLALSFDESRPQGTVSFHAAFATAG
jgi:putative acetyltransferase